MKVLLMGDSSKEDEFGENIKGKLLKLLHESNNKFIHYDVNKDDLKHCIGCFSCWLKTPGICLFDDVGRSISRDCVQSDIMIFVTPVKYGCYSVAIRRAMDRLLPNILPFFKKINNKIHHEARYKKYPSLVVIGYGEGITGFEIETFKCLTDANAVNFHCPNEPRAYVCRFNDDVDRMIDSLKSYFYSKEGVTV